MDNAKDIDVGMLMYNSIEYSDNYSKTSGSLWQYYRDEPFLDPNGNIVDFLLIIITVLRLNFTQIQQTKQEMMEKKMLKLWYHENI